MQQRLWHWGNPTKRKLGWKHAWSGFRANVSVVWSLPCDVSHHRASRAEAGPRTPRAPQGGMGDGNVSSEPGGGGAGVGTGFDCAEPAVSLCTVLAIL